QNMDDIGLQAEEIEAISSIYGENWRVIDPFSRIFSFSQTVSKCTLDLRFTLPLNYPSEKPPEFLIKGAGLKQPEIEDLKTKLICIYSENIGEGVLFLWIEAAREFMQDLSANDVQELPLTTEENISCVNVPEIKHGEPLTDRKSTFQGHLATVHCANDVKLVLCELLKNRKIQNATHNISAYRIYDEHKTIIIQDCNDDGETAAGTRMLHLLQILDVKNVLVVVSRWYGGIQLGPDRFKHINNVTRSILLQEGFIDKSNKSKKAKK
uniref:RWD domain-containing protein n=1 Tax=Ciona savignyi TaxID=51511 RepID=H2ZPV9_CIOSA